MMEGIIYSAGVVSLTIAYMLVIFYVVYLTFYVINEMLLKKLNSLYRHTQLYFFMGEVMRKGYAQAKDDIGKNDN